MDNNPNASDSDHGVAAVNPAVVVEPKNDLERVNTRTDGYGVSVRPSIGQWIKLHWLDILTLVR